MEREGEPALDLGGSSSTKRTYVPSWEGAKEKTPPGPKSYTSQDHFPLGHSEKHKTVFKNRPQWLRASDCSVCWFLGFGLLCVVGGVGGWELVLVVGSNSTSKYIYLWTGGRSRLRARVLALTGLA